MVVLARDQNAHVHAITRRAYEKGARFVDIWYFDGVAKRIRAETARGSCSYRSRRPG